jgi:primosomal protein N' (replication factor Y)
MENIAKVIVNLSLDKSFDYKVPERLSGQVRAGVQVNVPFGRSFRRGYVLSLKSHSDYPDLKEIESLCEKESRITPPLVKLGEWMAEYYCCSQEQAVRTLLPSAVRKGKVKRKTQSICSLGNASQTKKILDSDKAKAQIRIIKILQEENSLTSKDLLERAGTGRAALNALLKNGAVKEFSEEVGRDPYKDVEIIPSKPKEPTEEQAEALKTICGVMEAEEKLQHVVLLHGVTGSGKTEVYLQAIAKALESGQESIVLVPEISLTPQTVARFRARFGDMVSVLHSGLTDGERFDEWAKVSDGKVKIAVGARSALFAPFRNLGLIVVDEEHENSYKQDKAPRYHARDVAVMRGGMENAVVVLGSATPSFESYQNALSGKYILSKLTKRIDERIMPLMRVVDLKKEAGRTGFLSYFSDELVEEVRNRIARGEQTIIFLNRRGYARQMMCEQCGFVAECPECSVPYTYHRKKQTLSCHLCGAVIPAPAECPDCASPEIRYCGVGTERLESVAEACFKGARIARMDSDTMTARSSYEKTLTDFKKGNIDILIGTQMIAKGLHFPNVTLVGIINADQSLYIPDFRAEERTFQLLTQVAGRAGRGDVRGEVIVQSFTPFNPAIQAAVNHDYEGFFEEEMEIRKELNYPPEGRLIAVHVNGEDESAVAEEAEKIMNAVKPCLNSGISFSDPAPAPIERIKGRYRYMMIFRGKGLRRLRFALRNISLHPGRSRKGVEVYIDVDALSLM